MEVGKRAQIERCVESDTLAPEVSANATLQVWQEPRGALWAREPQELPGAGVRIETASARQEQLRKTSPARGNDHLAEVRPDDRVSGH